MAQAGITSALQAPRDIVSGVGSTIRPAVQSVQAAVQPIGEAIDTASGAVQEAYTQGQQAVQEAVGPEAAGYLGTGVQSFLSTGSPVAAATAVGGQYLGSAVRDALGPEVSGFLGGATTGATYGSLFGVPGQVVGGVLGGLYGLATAEPGARSLTTTDQAIEAARRASALSPYGRDATSGAGGTSFISGARMNPRAFTNFDLARAAGMHAAGSLGMTSRDMAAAQAARDLEARALGVHSSQTEGRGASSASSSGASGNIGSRGGSYNGFGR